MAVSVGVMGAVVAGSLVLPASPAYAGVDHVMRCPGEDAAWPAMCPDAMDIDRARNVTSVSFDVPPRATAYLTVTMEQEDGFARNERTVSVMNAIDDIQRMQWSVPPYDRDMTFRIVRVELHFSTPR
ncbi:hypothetical protein Ae406Ps2_6238 [Pseudonocardia sp. Ae406_Ps2]|nr:hypothetical protein Ae406Ps2_6238 [Pseudonocardia sp. Ae406_Ps2]OLM09836.1 hypothetical protein Ae706Ps2_6298 [Pseudonocardia sp. Ae706_Ps2]